LHFAPAPKTDLLLFIPRSRQNSFKSLVHLDKFPATYKLYTAIHVKLNQLSTMMAKTTPYLPCLPAGRLATGTISCQQPGLVAGWLRRVTFTYFIAVPLCTSGFLLQLKIFSKKLLLL
jgi:hypothetical protein